MLGRATDLSLGLSPLGTCLTTPRPWLWRDWHWEAIHFLLQTYSETTFSSFQAHSSLPCWFGLPQQENVATHSISTLICHPAVVATNTLFSPPHYQQVHFNVRNVNFFCHFVSSCYDSTLYASIFTNLMNAECFALIIFGWMGVCRRRDMRLIHMRTFQDGPWLIKEILTAGMHWHSFLNKILIWHMPFLAFRHTYRMFYEWDP